MRRDKQRPKEPYPAPPGRLTPEQEKRPWCHFAWVHEAMQSGGEEALDKATEETMSG